MRTSFFTLFALGGLFASSIASPIASSADIEKRQTGPTAALVLLDDLFATIQTYTGTINSTVAGINSESTAAEKASASAIVNQAVSGITASVANSAVSAGSLSAVKARALQGRQATSTTAIAAAIEMILLELSGTLNGVIAALGLTSLLGFLTPLTTALSQLIAALEVVVDDLLVIVEELLNGILTGLSLALAGLVL